MTYGFEREYFLFKGADFVAAPADLPRDQCGFLAEARGTPRDTPLEAVFSMMADEYSIKIKARELGLELITATPQKLPFKLRRDCARENGKGVQTDFTMSGKWNNPHVQHAGLHIHFGAEQEVRFKGEYVGKYMGRVLNIPRMIYLLDGAFKKSILAAKRGLGMYELKSYGFEYRSLPAHEDPIVVAEFIASKEFSRSL